MDTFPSPPELPEPPPALQPASAMAPKIRAVEPARNLAFMGFNLFSSLSGTAGIGHADWIEPAPPDRPHGRCWTGPSGAGLAATDSVELIAWRSALSRRRGGRRCPGVVFPCQRLGLPVFPFSHSLPRRQTFSKLVSKSFSEPLR